MARVLGVVTGSSGTIGTATCAALAQAGVDVVGIDLRPASAVRTFECDLAAPAAVRGTFAEIEHECGPVGILVNNAGISLRRPFLETSDDDLARTMAVNFTAAFVACQQAVPQMRRAGGGSIINISSVVARAGGIYADYSASKAALIELTKSLAVLYARDGIRVNAVAPGAVETAMVATMDPALRESFTSNTPMARFGRAEEIASAVAFLAGPGSTYMTGAIVDVNGGLC